MGDTSFSQTGLMEYSGFLVHHAVNR